MKKLILISATALMLMNCKKSSSSSSSSVAASSPDIYCVYTVAPSGINTFYRCCKSTSDMQQAVTEIRNAGKQSTSIIKKDCKDC